MAETDSLNVTDDAERTDPMVSFAVDFLVLFLVTAVAAVVVAGLL